MGYHDLIKMPLFYVFSVIDKGGQHIQDEFRNQWEQVRLVCAYQSVSFSGGKVEPKKLFKFEWERAGKGIVTIDQIFAQMGMKKDGSE